MTAKTQPAPPAPSMRYITRLRIENFQSHADTDIHLEPGINLFTGLGDAGKTAVLRALNLVLHNQPRGKDFIRWGENEARVTVWFSDNTVVQRIKGDRNTVLLQKPDGTKKSFDRIGNELPDEVREALGNPPVNEKQGPLSYAEQLRPMFLITLTPTELPRVISELTQIDDYQESADRLGRQSREMEKAIKASQERINRYDGQLQAYEGLEDEEEFLTQCEGQAEYIESLETEIADARNLFARMKEVVTQGTMEAAALKTAQVLAAHSDASSAALAAMQRAESARSLYLRSEELNTSLNDSEKALVRAKRFGDDTVTNESARLRSQADLIAQMQTRLKESRSITETSTTIKAEAKQWNGSMAELEAERDRLVLEMKEAGFWCNHCNRPLMEEDKCHA